MPRSLLVAVLVGWFGTSASVGASPAALLAQDPPKTSPLVAPPDVGAPPADAQTTTSGLAFKVLKEGTGGARPKGADRVTVHYTGWTADGKMFDSSVARRKPSTFPLDRVLPGWREGVQMMVVGEKRRFWVPEALAFNKQPGRPAGPVVFDIELLDVEVALEAPATPPDVAAPPADAEKRRSGLASKVIRPGNGTVRPKSSSTVTVHYTGWTRDGKMFESTVLQGRPATFRLDGVIEGWNEGLQLMVVGEVRRFWIPERLAYQGQAGAPRGMLVFDVALIAIK
jgi:peptidylprolyl isomerase